MIMHHAPPTYTHVPVQPLTDVGAEEMARVRRRRRGGGSDAFRRTRRWVQKWATHPLLQGFALGCAHLSLSA